MRQNSTNTNIMLLDLNGNVLINPTDQNNISDNWKEYLRFSKNTHLWSFTKQELLNKVNSIKQQSRTIINSALLLGHFLRELSVNDNFHQQFKTAFPKLDSKSLLGMQLYMLLLKDDEKWIFMKPDESEAIFTNASYIISE